MDFFRQSQTQRSPEDAAEINALNAKETAELLGIKCPEIKIHERVKDEPNEDRLFRALADLPLPAAFSDAMIALRKIRKERNSQDDTELKQIYQLAIWQSFCVTPYSKIAECPTFEILADAFDEVKKLPYSWQEYGYEKLNLQSADIKAMVSFWGEPKTHKTLNQVYKQLYKETELRLKPDF